ISNGTWQRRTRVQLARFAIRGLPSRPHRLGDPTLPDRRPSLLVSAKQPRPIDIIPGNGVTTQGDVDHSRGVRNAMNSVAVTSMIMASLNHVRYHDHHRTKGERLKAKGKS